MKALANHKPEACSQQACFSGKAVSGAGPDHVVSPGAYDQKHIDRIGRMHNCIAYGPGMLDLAHQPDEYFGGDDMIDAAKVMALALKRLLG